MIEFSNNEHNYKFIFPQNQKFINLAPLAFLKELCFKMQEIRKTHITPQKIKFVVKDNNIKILKVENIRKLNNYSDWWYWTKREDTPIFPAELRILVSKQYPSKYNSDNKSIMYYKDNYTHIYYNKKDIYAFQEIWCKSHIDDNINNKEKKLINQLKRLTAFAKKLPKNLNRNKINDYINKYSELYSESVDLTNEAFLGGFLLENFLRNLFNLKCDLLNIKNKENLFEYLTTIKNKKSWIAKVEDKLFNLKIKIGFNKKINTISQLKTQLTDTKLINEWIKIHKKYFWVSYNWTGPGLTEHKLFEIYKSIKHIKNKPTKINLQKIKINTIEKRLYRLLGYLIFAKDWRNGMYSQASYYFNNWLKDICYKFNINYENTFWLSKYELTDLIINNKLPIDIDERKKECILIKNKNNNITIYSKENINKTIEQYKLELPDKNNNSELVGQIASSGLVIGKVKLTKKGLLQKLTKKDIIVATSFHPEDTGLLMHVGGIILEEGGITSHISIIARELGIPCIINVKNATKILKDNDLIEVDANTGIIKKLK